MGGNNQSAGYFVGYNGSEVLTDDVETKVDTGSNASGCQDVLFVYIEHIGLKLNERKRVSQLVRISPMCRRALPFIRP
jgi:hypothetical protein